MMSRIILTSLTVLLALGGYSQDFLKYYRASLKPYYAESFAVTTEATVYSGTMKLSVLERNRNTYQKSGDNLRITSLVNDQFITPKMLVVVDYQEEALMVSPVLHKNNTTKPFMPMDSLFGRMAAPLQDGNFFRNLQVVKKNDLVGFVFGQVDDRLLGAELWFSATDSTLLKATYFPNYPVGEGENERLYPVVEYVFTYHAQKPEKQVFDTTQFFTRKGAQVVPSPKYRHYTILNHL